MRLDIEQRSKAWHELRSTRIGASDCSVIMGKNPWKTPLMLWKEKMHGEKAPLTPSMQKGIDLEDEARVYYAKLLDLNLEPAVFLSDENPWQLASLDGWDGRNAAIVEIKCVGKKTFDEVKEGKVPEYYEWQVQHQMAVTGSEKAFLCFYWRPDEEIQSVEFCIPRDEERILELTSKEKEFYCTNMLGFVEPNPIEQDIVQRNDEKWMDLAQRYRIIARQLKELEEEEALLRKTLIEEAKDASTSGCGVRLVKYKRVGTIDYKEIPALKDVDLEPFRKSATIQWKITLQ
jgi:putative phage-type endonuclease